MSAPLKISTPSVDVQGFSFVQESDGVSVYYRNPNGDLEASFAVKFWDNGSGIGLFRGVLPPGSVFSADASGRIALAN